MLRTTFKTLKVGDLFRLNPHPQAQLYRKVGEEGYRRAGATTVFQYQVTLDVPVFVETPTDRPE